MARSKRRRPRAKSESAAPPVSDLETRLITSLRQAVAISKGEMAQRFEFEISIRFDRAGQAMEEDTTAKTLTALIRDDVSGLAGEEYIDSIEVEIKRSTIRGLPPRDPEVD